MPRIESPLGSKNIKAAPLREFNVPDGNEGSFDVDEAIRSGGLKKLDMNEIAAFQARMDGEQESPQDIEREIKAAKEARRRGTERLTDSPRRRIEMLIGMTRLTRVADIDGNSYVFQTLKSREMREAILEASQFDKTVQSAFEIRKQFLARSIIQIGGVDIDQFIGSDDLEHKKEFIDELDDALLNRLYEEYLALTKEASEKYSIKTDAQVQEVVSDLKK